MPTIQDQIDNIEIILNEYNLKLIEYEVNLAGVRQISEDARDASFRAVTDISLVYGDSIRYMDTQIEGLRQEFQLILNNAYISITNTSNDYTDDMLGGYDQEWRNEWSGWYDSVSDSVATIINRIGIVDNWIEETTEVEIPALLEQMNQFAERADEQALELQEEAVLSRQEIVEMGNRWRGIADEIERTKEKILEMDYSAYEQRAELYSNVTAEFDGRFAGFEQKITVAAGEIGAVADRVETLSVEYGSLNAEVENLERAMIEGDEALAAQITALSVGNNTQFDPANIWHFDTTNEGWSGNWADFFLDAGDTATSPVLSVNGGRYRQVRFRLEKVGSPVWNGHVRWDGDTPSSGSGVAIPEPSWSGDYMEFSVNMDWSGTISRIFIDLSTGSDSNNKYLIDWVSIGSPSPGASTASLNQEIQARITGDSANAQSIQNLETSLTNTQGTVTSQGQAISGISTTITSLDGRITNQGQVINDLSGTITNINTNVTALGTAVSGLNNTVSSFGDTIDSIQTNIVNLETIIDGKANISALNSLSSRVTANESGIETIQTAITQLEAEIEGIGGSSVIQGIQNTLNNHEGRIASNAAAITSINTSVDTLNQSKADVSVVNTLAGRVTETENAITLQGTSITSINNSLTSTNQNVTNAQRAAEDAAALAGTKGKVIIQPTTPAVADRDARNLWIDTTGNNNTPKRWSGSAWEAVSDKAATDALAAANNALGQLPDKASVSALQALEGIVSDQGGVLTSHATLIQGLESKIGVPEQVKDYFNYETTQQAQEAGWESIQGSGEWGIETVPDTWGASVNNNVLFIGNNALPDYRALRYTQKVPVMYGDIIKVTARVRRVSGTSRGYLGFRTYNKNDTFLSNNIFYRMSGNSPSVFETFVGYFSLTGTRSNPIGSTIDDPALLDPMTSYGTFTVAGNSSESSAGKYVVDFFSVEVVTENSAQASAISNLETQVTQANSNVAAMASAITSLSAGTGSDVNTALFRMNTVAGPAGYSRIALEARATNASGWKRAGMTIDVPTAPNEPSQIVIAANKFAITNNETATGTKTVPFFVQGGQVYIESAVIGILRSATSGARMEMHRDRLIVYNELNQIVVLIGRLD